MTTANTPSAPLRVFISAAEPSGDMHGASLIQHIRIRRPDTHFVGVAGPRMRAAGCQSLFDMTAHSAMLLGVAGGAARAITVLQRTTREFTRRHYDAAVVIDSPMLNLPIALRAKMRAIPVLYYIAPQLWAWGAWRLHKLRARTDKLAVVLPFEEEFFRAGGLDATYVGHPLFDVLTRPSPHVAPPDRFRSVGRPVLALLPGSRKHVVNEVLPGQLAVAATVRARFPNAYVAVSVAGPQVEPHIRRHLAASTCPAVLHPAPNADLLSATDLALVASGTATLEIAHYRCPMVVMYNGSKIMYHLLGRWLIHTRHFSLVNILAKRRLVPEFMPYYDSPAPIARCAVELLSSPDRLETLRRELAELMAGIDAPGASARTADLLLSMIDAARHA